MHGNFLLPVITPSIHHLSFIYQLLFKDSVQPKERGRELWPVNLGKSLMRKNSWKRNWAKKGLVVQGKLIVIAFTAIKENFISS